MLFDGEDNDDSAENGVVATHAYEPLPGPLPTPAVYKPPPPPPAPPRAPASPPNRTVAPPRPNRELERAHAWRFHLESKVRDAIGLARRCERAQRAPTKSEFDQMIAALTSALTWSGDEDA